MNIKDFAATLAAELCSRGISRDDAMKHALTLIKTLTEDDIREITEYRTAEDFAELSDSLAELINEKNQRRIANDAPQTANVNVSVGEAEDIGATRSYKIVPSAVFNTAEDMAQTVVGDAVTSDALVLELAEEQEIYLEEGGAIREKVVLTPRGRGFFIAVSVLTSPLWICLAAVVLALFGLSIAAVCLMIAFAMCLVCVETAGGGILTLVGIIWGVSRMFVGTVGIGLYEVGLGIVIGGASLALGILTYNFATVTLPYLLRHLISFEGYCLRHVGPLLDRMREECNRL